ncbi:WD40 repeat-like protein [Mycena venus]|uniref:WD40 repeat-like protein n=1 Tax=Mycena venus TaxID=2733690 RepID=A0A8H6XKJ1_9AGAR|nr:WD40 repeat-like protein [Mycena venus]
MSPRFREGNICLGVANTSIARLLQHCTTGTDGAGSSVYALELLGVSQGSKGKPAGTITVRLMPDSEAAATTVEQSQRTLARLKVGETSSATEIVTKSVATGHDLESALSAITAKLELIVGIGDEIATIHPYINIAWKVLTSVYKVVKKQKDTDAKLTKLVETMVEVYSFVEDVDFLPQKIKGLELKTLAIAKQTVECALFIQEYTANGFSRRAIENSWTLAEKKIDDLSAVLRNLKDSFEGRLAVQSLFLSTKMLGKIEALEQSDLLKRLNPVEMDGASRPLCLPGTRRQILDDITEWITIPSESGNILWLTGVAGSGKSTISTTIAESFRAVHRLGAFMFFDRNAQATNHPNGIIRTIAYSLALSNLHIASTISGVIQRDPNVVNAPIRTQFTELLLEPLGSVESLIQGPILVILDGLDECGDPDSRDALLSIISTEFPKLPRLLRFLITSRVEADIFKHFRSRFAEKKLDTEASTQDVQFFIHYEMDRIRQQNDFGPAWPTMQDRTALVNLAGGLFIWASTAVRFIDGYRPNERLQALITQKSKGLDSLYSIALRNSGPWDTDTMFTRDARAVLACIVLGIVPMTDRTIDMLLGSSHHSSAEVLKYLGCVVQWSLGTQARTLHASFVDYLTDPQRSGGEPWAIDTKTGHGLLSLGCLQILGSELCFNICDLEDSHLLNADVRDLSNRVTAMISPQLLYSTCFWFRHIREAPFDETIVKVMKALFHEKILYWLEVLSVLGQVPIALAALGIAANYIKGSDDRLKELIVDTIKFVSAFETVIKQSATHIYLSALPFTHPGSKLAQQFRRSFPCTLGFKSVLGPSIQNVLRGHSGTVSSVHFSPNGTRIASGSHDWTVCVWEAETGTLVAGPFEGHTERVTCVHFSPDGASLASGSDDRTVRVWDVETGTLLAPPMEGHTDRVTCVEFSPDGSRIASGSLDNTVRLWNARTGALLAEPFEGHTEGVTSLNFSPNGARLASGSWDEMIRVWDVETGRLVAGPFQEDTGKLTCINFSPDGAQIASGSSYKTVHIRDVQTGALILGASPESNAGAIFFSSGAGSLAFGANEDWTTRIWDPQSGALVTTPFQGHTNSVTSVQFSPDGARIASGSDDRTVRVWDAKTGALIAGPFEGHMDAVTSLSFSTDGAWIASGSEDKTIHIWDSQTAFVPTQPVNSAHFSPDSGRVAYGCEDSTIRICDSQTGALVTGSFKGHTDSITCIRFSPDSTQIVSGSWDNTVRLWDGQSGMPIIGPMKGHTRIVSSVDFSADGTLIASGSDDWTVRVWNAQNGALFAGPFEGHTDCVTSVNFCQNRQYIVSGSEDYTVRVWDAETGTLLAGPFEGHKDCVSSVNFSPDGAWIASGSWDNTVRIWDAQTGVTVRIYDQTKNNVGPTQGDSIRVTSVDFSPDGSWIASGSDDGTVRVWDAQTGALVAGPFKDHKNSVTSVNFSPDSAKIVSASKDGTVRISKIDPHNDFRGNFLEFDRYNAWIVNAAGGAYDLGSSLVSRWDMPPAQHIGPPYQRNDNARP